jgi:hypothetical protein
VKRSTFVIVSAARKAERRSARNHKLSRTGSAKFDKALGHDPSEAEPQARSAAMHGVELLSLPE